MEKVEGEFINMAVKKEEVLSNLTVIKRNGKKMEFKPKKIAIAIKKGFDDVIESFDDELEPKYTEKDMQVVFHDVLDKINKEYIKYLI